MANHQLQNAFLQLQWTERRRQKIIRSVNSHFGSQNTLLGDLTEELPLLATDDFFSLVDSREPETVFRELAFSVDHCEARTLALLRKSTSPYPGHVEEQILLASRNAGQDAARSLLKRDSIYEMSLAELFACIQSLYYVGLADDKIVFPILKPLQSASLHYSSCAHLAAWQGLDPLFLSRVSEHWLNGLLDILNPNVKLFRLKSHARGDSYGLDLFIPKEKISSLTFGGKSSLVV